jgi:hypothetical protein
MLPGCLTISYSQKKARGCSQGHATHAVRKDAEPDPPRLFRGFKYVIENPEDYEDFNASVKQYLGISSRTDCFSSPQIQ